MRSLLYIFLLFFGFQMTAQVDYEAEQRKLELKKANLLKEIKEVQSLLSTSKKKERDILSELNAQTKKIQLQENLINNSQKQKRNLSNDIYVNTLAANKLKRELKVLQADYAKTVRMSFKSRSDQSKVLFILSSESFLQAYKRIQYLKQYANFRKSQGDDLQRKTEELAKINANLEVQKIKQQKIIDEQEQQRKVLEVDRQKQNELMALVKKDNKQFNSQIKTKQNETKKIDQEIKRLIQKSIKEANRRAREAREKAEREARAKAEREAKAKGKPVESVKPTVSKPVVSSPGKLDMTPEDTALANSFKANKGRLPWPVEKGNITLGYGDQPHPDYPQLTIHNSGVEITTESGAAVRSVYEGEVMNIQIIGGTRAVSIRHGEYITVYQNLSSVSVSVGQKVSTKQRIGTVASSNGKSVLKFVISQNTSINNPQSWLMRK